MKSVQLTILAIFASFQLATAQTWLLPSSGTWEVGTNWSGGTFPNSAGSTAVLGTSITNNSTITLGTNITVGNLTINDNNNYLVTNSSINFNQTGGSTILVTNSGGNGSHNLRSSIVFSNDITVAQWSTGAFTIGGARTGTGNLIKEGTGTLILTNSSTVSGEVRVNNGRLTYGAGNPILGGSLVKVGDGTGTSGSATLFLDSSMGGASGIDIQVESDGLVAQGNNRLLRIESLSGVGETRLNTTVGNGMDFNGNGASNNSTYSGTITGGIQLANMDPATASRINKTGTSTLTLAASNSYVARTFIANGTLAIANDWALGLGTAFSNATYVTGLGSLGLLSNTTTAEPLFLNGRGGELGAVRAMSGSNRITGPVAIGWSGGTVVGTNASLGAEADSALVITSGITSTNPAIGLTKLGAGTVILEGASTYSGTTIVEGGTLTLASSTNPAIAGNLTVSNGTALWRANNQLSNSSIVTIAGTNEAAANLNLGTFTNSVQTVNLNNGTISSSGSGRLTTTGAVNASNGIIAGNLSVGTTLSKSGTGTVTINLGVDVLSPSNTVNNGWLTVAGSLGGITTVSNAGTVAGTGILGTLNIDQGGTLRPGNSPGTITATNGSAWLSGGSYVWEINNVSGPAGTTWDLLDVTGGALSLGGITNVGGFTIFLTSLNTNNSPGIAFGFNPMNTYTNWLIASAPTITGFVATNFTLDTNSFFGADGEFFIEQRAAGLNQGLYIVYQPSVPEPGTWAAGFLCAIILLITAYSRRKKLSNP